MAILKDSAGSVWSLFEMEAEPMPPRGTFAATIIGIRDRFGVERRKFQSEETEKVDLTQFLFGFRDGAGQPHQIASRVMKISGNEKSALYQFLTALLGEPPKMGWDYMEMKGRKVLVTVAHQPKRSDPGESYATIASVSPLPAGYGEAPQAGKGQHQDAKTAKAATSPTQPPPAPAPVEDDAEPLPF